MVVLAEGGPDSKEAVLVLPCLASDGSGGERESSACINFELCAGGRCSSTQGLDCG